MANYPSFRVGMLICCFPPAFEGTKVAEHWVKYLFTHSAEPGPEIRLNHSGRRTSLFPFPPPRKPGSVRSCSFPSLRYFSQGGGGDICKGLPTHSFCMNNCALKLLKAVL